MGFLKNIKKQETLNEIKFLPQLQNIFQKKYSNT